jgi:hypothetical protein
MSLCPLGQRSSGLSRGIRAVCGEEKTVDTFRSSHPQPASEPAPPTPSVPSAIPSDLDREGHLIRLLFESRQLALKQFRPGLFHGSHEAPLLTGPITAQVLADHPELEGFAVKPVCKECGRAQSDNRLLDHSAACSAGAVLLRLDALEAGVRDGAPLPAQVATGPQLCLGLPLRAVSGVNATVEDSDGRVIVDMAGSEVSWDDELVWAERIALSVNACAALSPESLRALVENRLARAAMQAVYAPDDAVEAAAPAASREWIIQRCTQRWQGNDLVYEDFPTPEGLMTREEMVAVLDRVNREYSAEFRGHRLSPAERACAAWGEGVRR